MEATPFAEVIEWELRMKLPAPIAISEPLGAVILADEELLNEIFFAPFVLIVPVAVICASNSPKLSTAFSPRTISSPKFSLVKLA